MRFLEQDVDDIKTVGYFPCGFWLLALFILAKTNSFLSEVPIPSVETVLISSQLIITVRPYQLKAAVTLKLFFKGCFCSLFIHHFTFVCFFFFLFFS